MLSSMHCYIYEIGEPLFHQGDVVSEVHFFYKGSAKLTKKFTSVYGETQLEVGILPAGSWWGELIVLLGLRSYFGLQTD